MRLRAVAIYQASCVPAYISLFLWPLARTGFGEQGQLSMRFVSL